MENGDTGSHQDAKRRKIENGVVSITNTFLSLPPKIVYHIISFIPLHEQFLLREISKRAHELAGIYLRALPRVDLSPYPTLVNEELIDIIALTNHSTFLDVSGCKYISYETASQLAATYPNLVMKVDNSLFSNKHRLKKDTALVKSLYKLVWNDGALNSRVLSLFQNLRKLDLSVCEVNLAPLANNALALGYIRFLKLTNVAFTKPNSLHTLLKSSSTLEVLVVRDCTNVTEHDFEPIIHHPNLFKLVIRGRAMAPSTWQHLRTQGHAALKQLGIDQLPDVEDADVIVAEALAQLPRLKSLILGVKLVNDDFIETLSSVKNPFANIKKLYLGDSAFDTGCVITEDGLELAGQLFPNCEKVLLSGVENITAFNSFSLVEELQVYGGSYDTTDFQNIILNNKFKKLTLEHVTPDDEGEVPLLVNSSTLESFTSSKEEFGFDGGLEDLKPFFDNFNGNVCAVNYQEREKIWYSNKGGSLMGSLTLAVKFGIPYNKELDKQETEIEELEEGVVAYRKFPANFFEEMSSAISEEEKAELAREMGVWDRCLFIELSSS